MGSRPTCRVPAGCFCDGVHSVFVVVFLWWCGGVFVAVWCSFGGVFVVVFVVFSWWCFCGVLVVLFLWCLWDVFWAVLGCLTRPLSLPITLCRELQRLPQSSRGAQQQPKTKRHTRYLFEPELNCNFWASRAGSLSGPYYGTQPQMYFFFFNRVTGIPTIDHIAYKQLSRSNAWMRGGWLLIWSRILFFRKAAGTLPGYSIDAGGWQEPKLLSRAGWGRWSGCGTQCRAAPLPPLPTGSFYESVVFEETFLMTALLTPWFLKCFLQVPFLVEKKKLVHWMREKRKMLRELQGFCGPCMAMPLELYWKAQYLGVPAGVKILEDREKYAPTALEKATEDWLNKCQKKRPLLLASYS